jgi:hypothetical protein
MAGEWGADPACEQEPMLLTWTHYMDVVVLDPDSDIE